MATFLRDGVPILAGLRGQMAGIGREIDWLKTSKFPFSGRMVAVGRSALAPEELKAKHSALELRQGLDVPKSVLDGCSASLAVLQVFPLHVG